MMPNHGKATLQLRSYSISNVDNWSYVCGIIQVDGVLPSQLLFQNMFYPVQGIYSKADSSLTLIATPSRSQQLYLSLPQHVSPIPKLMEQLQLKIKEVESATGNKTGDQLYSKLTRNEAITALVSQLILASETGLSRDSGNYSVSAPREHKMDSLKNVSIDVSGGVLDTSSAGEGGIRHVKGRRLRGPDLLDAALFTPTAFLPDDPAVLRNLTEALFPYVMTRAEVGDTGVHIVVVPVGVLSEKTRARLHLEEKGMGDGLLSETFRSYQSRPLAQLGVAPPADRSDGGGDKAAKGASKEELSALSFSQCLLKASLVSSAVGKGVEKSVPGTDQVLHFEGRLNSESYLSKPVFPACSLLSDLDISVDFFDLQGVLSRKTWAYCWIEGLLCVLQIFLLISQLRHVQTQVCYLWPANMNHSQFIISITQAAASKISILGIFGQALIDSLLCVLHLLLSNIFHGEYFYYFIPVAVLKLTVFAIFEMRLVLIVYQSRFAQEIGAQGWNGMRQYLALVHMRFYACLFAALVFIFLFQNRPVVVVLVLYSFWIPQIAYNAVAGVRKAFFPTFAMWMSLYRIFFPLYLLACPQNLFAVIEGRDYEPVSPLAAVVLLFWISGQVLLLHLQDLWGPRFFVPAWMLPVKYNYERPIPLTLLERRNGVSEEANINGREDVEGGNLIECVICYHAVDPSLRDYMLTPCDHLFHRECLSQWLEQKLECPVCRASLPSIE